MTLTFFLFKELLSVNMLQEALGQYLFIIFITLVSFFPLVFSPIFPLVFSLIFPLVYSLIFPLVFPPFPPFFPLSRPSFVVSRALRSLSMSFRFISTFLSMSSCFCVLKPTIAEAAKTYHHLPSETFPPLLYINARNDGVSYSISHLLRLFFL